MHHIPMTLSGPFLHRDQPTLLPDSHEINLSSGDRAVMMFDTAHVSRS